MTSKTSSFKFNNTIFRKNIVRFWPLWVLYTVVMIFLMPVSLYSRMRYFAFSTETDLAIIEADKTTVLLSVIDNAMNPIPIAVACIVSAVAVFSYLYTTRSCNMMHAFPVKRTEMFATNYISGLLFVIVPQVISFFVALIIFGVCDIPNIQYLITWLLLMLGMSFFFFSLSVLCCMLTGHFLGGVAFFVVFNLIYVGVATLLVVLAEQICYGLHSLNTGNIPGMILSPLVYLAQNENLGTDYDMIDMLITEVTINGGEAVGLYCIPAVIFIIISVLLYKKRNLECAAEISAHSFVKPLIRWIVTIPVSIGLAYWFSIVFFEGERYYLTVWIVVLIILSWACFFVLEMIINKKFKIFKKKRFLEWGVCLAAMLVTAGLLEGDVFGLEKRIPQAEEVHGVIISANHEMVLTEPEEIQRAIEAHQAAINGKTDYENAYYSEEQTTARVEFEYFLKSGDSFTRTYYVPDSADYINDGSSTAAQVRNLQEDTDSYLKQWMLVNYEDVTIIGGTYYTYAEDGEEQVELTAEGAQVIYEAMLKDIEENNIGCYIGPETHEDVEYYNFYIDIHGVTKEIPVEIYQLDSELRQRGQSDEYYEEMTIEQSYYYYEQGPDGYVVDRGFELRSSCVHTIQALIDIGVIKSEADLRMEEY